MTTPSYQSTSAILVGNAFVNQYYNVLHQQPESVHKFFTDASSMMRGSSDSGGAMCIYRGQEEIHKKIMSLGFNSVKAEIKSVDSMESLQSGVIVMVTGFLSNRGEEKRSFVQSFFLAPQEKGYYVLSDIFRYLEEGKHIVVLNDVNQPQVVTEENTPVTSDVHEVVIEKSEIDSDISNPSMDQPSQSLPESNLSDIEHRNQEGNEVSEKDIIPDSINDYNANAKVKIIYPSPPPSPPTPSPPSPPSPSPPLPPSLPTHENVSTPNETSSSPSAESSSKKSYASILSAIRGSITNRQVSAPTNNQPPQSLSQSQSKPLPQVQSQPQPPQSQPKAQSHSQTKFQPKSIPQPHSQPHPLPQPLPPPPSSSQSQPQSSSQSQNLPNASTVSKIVNSKSTSLHQNPQTNSIHSLNQTHDGSSPPSDSAKEFYKGVNSAETEVYADGGRSVYLKHLPFGLTSAELFEEMKQFGNIKPEGVQVKNKAPNICFGFVEFEDATSATNSIQKSFISIKGQNVKIEKKLTTTYYKAGFRGRGFSREKIRGRGSTLPGRGSNFKPYNQANPAHSTFNQTRTPGLGNRHFQTNAPDQPLKPEPSETATSSAPNPADKDISNNALESYHKQNNFENRGFRGNRRGSFKNYGNRGGYVRVNPVPSLPASSSS